MKKNAFTLVEILAVIVIIGVIFTLVIPKISNTVLKNKQMLFKEQESRLEKAALKYINEKYYDNTISSLKITKEELITAGYIDEIYDVNNNNSTCNGFVIIINLNTTPISRSFITCESDTSVATNVIINNENISIDDTIEKNVRYVGLNPNNYVSFNEELWRIIGIFDVSNGNIKEERIKLIGPSIDDYSWDTNSTGGYNIWETKTGTTKEDGTTTSDINILLNTLYYNGTSITCYGGNNNATTACPTARLNETAKSMIGNAVWNIGGLPENNISPSVSYNYERGTRVPLPEIAQTEWIGKVGLIYPSDYGYATVNCSTLSSNDCKNDNWLGGSNYWTMTSNYNSSFEVFHVNVEGNVTHYNPHNILDIKPVVYLKSNVKIIDGSGTSTSPYQLSL